MIPRAVRRLGLSAGLAAAALAPAAAQSAPAAGTVVRSVEAASRPDGSVLVTIVADGPLPRPAVGRLDGPPRIYFDFRNVVPAPGIPPAAGSGGIRGVRVGQPRRNPPVARVVIDLEAAASHAIDDSARETGRIAVVVGGPANAAAAAAAPRPAGQGAGGAISHAADRYRAAATPALERMQALRPLVSAMAAAGDAGPDAATAAAELEGLARTLRGLKPPPALATTHDLLLRFCALAGRAARLRSDPAAAADPASARNASSAAAGALIVLDRALADLGYPPPR